MGKSLFYCFFVSFLLIGCTTAVIRPPKLPEAPIVNYRPPETKVDMFRGPEIRDTIYAEKNRKKTQTKDNVSVKVSSIVENLDDEKYYTQIKAPDGNSYRYSIFPMMLVLKIRNSTDEIITLKKTFIHLENENEDEYILVDSFQENKKRLEKEISAAFNKYIKHLNSSGNTQEIVNKYLAEYKQTVYGDYQRSYNRMIKDILNAKSGLLTNGIKTPDMKSGYLRDGYLKQNYAPDTVYKKGIDEVQAKVNSIVSAERAETNKKIVKANKLKKNAIQQIKNLSASRTIITRDRYLPIRILPGKSKKVIVPFSKRKKHEKIKSILVSIYNLPTQVDASGDPIKRQNFNFHMVATDN